MSAVLLLSTVHSFIFPSSQSLVATRYGDDRSRRSAPVLSVAPDYELKRAAAQEWYQTWIKTRSLQEHLGVDRSNHQSIVAMATDEMPSVLGEWGCTHELWAKIRSKRVLLEYAESGDEAKARERLKMLRHSRSVLGISTPMPALLAAVGCDEALWAQIRSKASLVQLAEAGDEAGLRAKLETIRERVAQEAASAAASAPPPAAPRVFKRRGNKKLPIDEAKVEELIAQREEVRRARDFEKADAIRDELSAMGVVVFDKQKEWRVRWTGARAAKGKARKASKDYVPPELPAQLEAWGCDAELWDAIKSKGSLLKLVESGNEEYARRRIERMRELVAADAKE